MLEGIVGFGWPSWKATTVSKRPSSPNMSELSLPAFPTGSSNSANAIDGRVIVSGSPGRPVVVPQPVDRNRGRSPSWPDPPRGQPCAQPAGLFQRASQARTARRAPKLDSPGHTLRRQPCVRVVQLQDLRRLSLNAGAVRSTLWYSSSYALESWVGIGNHHERFEVNVRILLPEQIRPLVDISSLSDATQRFVPCIIQYKISNLVI